jgi:D-alanyl-D-alanine carboxypeptidase
VRSASALQGLLTETAEGRLLPGVRRCLLRIETLQPPDIWCGAATTRPDDGDGSDVDAAFRIASVTKMMTATALLMLCDQDRCELDDATGRFLSGDIVEGFLDSEGRAYAANLTLRQLLDHTSGLPNYFLEPIVLEAVRNGGGQRRFTPLDLVNVAATSAPPSPGRARTYTDTGFLLAGLIIESLTGEPLHKAYRNLVLDPVGMADTWLESSSDPPRQSQIASHDLDGADITDMDPTVDWAGGGLVSTAADLAGFLRALTKGQLLSPAAWAEMTKWQSGPEGYYDDYGLGLGRYRFPAAQLIGHHGVWGAFAFWSPELDAIITGTVNTGRIDRRPLLGAVVHALID